MGPIDVSLPGPDEFFAIRSHVDGRIEVDQIKLAPEFLEKRSHYQLVVAPDEPVPEVLPHGCGQLPQGRLAGCQGLASRHVNCLDLLHRHGCASHVHLSALPVLIVLALPDEFSLHQRERVRSVRAPADWLRHSNGPPGGAGRAKGLRAAKN